MASTSNSKNFKMVNPGPLDAWYGPYASVAAACAAIPNTESLVDGMMLNFRKDKVVGITTTDGTVEYWWPKVYTDIGLTKKNFYNKKNIVTSNQLFDKTSFLANTSVTSTGTLATYPSAGSSLNARTMKIAVDPAMLTLKISGLQHLGTAAYRWFFTDADGLTLTFGLINTEASSIIYIPSGAAFYYQLYRHPTLDTDPADGLLMVNYGSVALTLDAYTSERYNTGINDESIIAGYLIDKAKIQVPGTDPTSILNKASVLSLLPVIENTDTPVYNNNQIFDKATYLDNTVVGATGGIFVNSGSVNARTAVILIDTSKGFLYCNGFQHFLTVAYRWYFADASGNILTYGNANSAPNSLIAIPATALKFYLQFKHPTSDDTTAGDNLMINFGESALSYQAYAGFTIFTAVSKINGVSVGKGGGITIDMVTKFFFWFGKKAVFLGDSITAQMTWQATLCKILGLVYNPLEITTGVSGHAKTGLGGSRINPEVVSNGSGGYVTGQGPGESIFKRADDLHFYSPDIIFIMGLQNDGRKAAYNLSDVPYVGDEYLSTVTTKPSDVSALKGLLKKVITSNPLAKVVFMGPMYNGYVELTDIELASYKLRNDMVKSVCEMYSVQFIDMLNGVGLNPLNFVNFSVDTIHPNLLGGQTKIAPYIASRL